METTRIEARDAALQLLNRLTFWAGAAALAAVGVFAAVGAATIPGNASISSQAGSGVSPTPSTSNSSTAQSSSSSSSSSSEGLQSPGDVSSTAGGSGVVATGASH